MSIRAPYHHPLLDQRLLRDAAQESLRVEDCPEAVRNIALVGAVLDHAGYVDPTDWYRLLYTLQLLSEAGIPLHSNPAIFVYNLLPPIESDFLNAARKERPITPGTPEHIDLVVCCYIFAGIHDKTRLGTDLETSPFQFEYTPQTDGIIYEGVWGIAAENLNARFIFTFGGQVTEINPAHFKTRGGKAYTNLNFSDTKGVLIRSTNDIGNSLNPESALGKSLRKEKQKDTGPIPGMI
ncbi:MAG: hypothetical protein L6Q57_07155 [Alphaproteobacteria bacterium]|nr:hypothetical protein [Alphaproteobacteria bacterium]